MNLSSQVLDTKPVKYVSNQSFTGKNKFVKWRVAVETLWISSFMNNIITKSIYADKDNTFTSLQKLRKNKDSHTISR